MSPGVTGGFFWLNVFTSWFWWRHLDAGLHADTWLQLRLEELTDGVCFGPMIVKRGQVAVNLIRWCTGTSDIRFSCSDDYYKSMACFVITCGTIIKAR